MSFAIAHDSYDRYMGRYSAALAPRLIAFARIEPGMRALDVGCGTGALTAALADRLGATRVAGADPSKSLLTACADRVSGADVRLAPAERLPWPEASFDVVLSQLVLNFVPDADAALDEMRRVVRPRGVVAACTWDYAAGMRMLRTFWDAALELDALAPDEGRVMHYCTEEALAALWERRGLDNVETAPLDVEVEYQSFEDYWQPFTLGVGPAGAYCAAVDPEHRNALREICSRRLGSPKGAFTLTARAFAVRGDRSAKSAYE